MNEFLQHLGNTNRLGVEFVLTDLDVGLTFLDVAESSTCLATVHRNYENARKTYHAIMHLLKQLNPDEQKRSVIEAKLAVLKARLQAVGYGF